MSGPFTGKVAILTGASSGIGRAIALQLGVSGGVDIWLLGRDPRRLKEVAELVAAAGSHPVVYPLDLDREEEIWQLPAWVERNARRADGVRILSVFPGRTATPMQYSVLQTLAREYDEEKLLQPDDVASLVVHALSLPRTAEVNEISVRPLNG
jgi:NADP-dependent 3-hydroxy acid dehydrogenase YdfG